jgi:hypothetical protein
MALTLSGCFVIVSDTPLQENVIGDVIVHTVTCTSSVTSTDSCPNQGNSGESFNDTGPHDGQLLLAYRVPDGYGAPTQITSTSGSPTLVLNANPSYVSQLTSLAPPPAGEHWVGYMSSPLTAPASNLEYTFDTRFTRPPAQNGVPSGVPFKYLTVTGARENNDAMGSSIPSGRALNCGTTFPELHGVPLPMMTITDATTCVDSPAVATDATALPGDQVLLTRDLAIAPGTAVASRNSTVNVPFTLNYVGPSDLSLVFTLASSISGLSGASASPANPTFTPPSDSSTVQNAVVKVPAAAQPGTYSVPFSATLANGQTRDAVGTLTVLPDTKGPGVTISIAKLRLSKVSKGLKITVGCSEDCSILATLTASSKALKVAKTVKLGSAKAKLAAAGKKTLTVKLNRTGKKKLKALARHHRKLKAKLTVVATDGLGNKTRASRSLRLK